MEQAEIISVAHTRHPPDEAPVAEEAGTDISCDWDAAEIAPVEGEAGETARREEDYREDVGGGEEQVGVGFRGREAGREVGLPSFAFLGCG